MNRKQQRKRGNIRQTTAAEVLVALREGKGQGAILIQTIDAQYNPTLARFFGRGWR